MKITAGSLSFGDGCTLDDVELYLSAEEFIALTKGKVEPVPELDTPSITPAKKPMSKAAEEKGVSLEDFILSSPEF